MKIFNFRHSVRIYLQGGLGNQLFIMTAGLVFAIKKNRNLILDASLMPIGFSKRNIEIETINFPIPVRFSNGLSRLGSTVLIQIFNRLFKVNCLSRYFGRFVSDDVGFSTLPISKIGIRSLQGYFQSYLYFQELQNLLPNWNPLQDQHFSADYQSTLRELQILNPIVLHVRLGDYKQHADSFGLLSEKYYLDSLVKLRGLGVNSPIWLMSDEPLIAIKKFKSVEISRFVFPKLNSLEVMALMSHAKMLIISNSSFSWWAGSLAKQGTIVICPDKWFKNLTDPSLLCHPNWIRVSSSWEQ